MICCFRNGLLNLIAKHDVLAIDTSTKRVASYAFMVSFVVLMIISIWEICSTTDNKSDFSRNGTIASIPIETVFSIIGDIIKATVMSFGIVLCHWYIRICFILFFGRIRRIGIEIALTLIMLAYLYVQMNDLLVVNVAIVSIAVAFLYDIWRFADFRETQFQMNWIKKMVEEE